MNTNTSLTSSEQSLKPLHLLTHALTVYLYDLYEQLSQAIAVFWYCTVCILLNTELLSMQIYS